MATRQKPEKPKRLTWEGAIPFMSVGRLKMDYFSKHLANIFQQDLIAKLGHTNPAPGRPGHSLWLVIRQGGGRTITFRRKGR